jgi:uncharacterized repeat protein (TIGR01451 family)
VFDLGSEVTQNVVFRNSSAVPVDPTTVTVTITLPDGTTAAPSPTRLSVGIYTYAYVPTQAGRHVVNWNATQ